MSTDSGSGNRWEPTPPPVGDADGPATERVEQPQQREHAVWREGLPARSGWLVAGAAAVVFVVGGAGGFMVGHATAADAQDRTQFGQQGPRNGFGPGGGLPGQPPGMSPRQDDRRGQDSGRNGSGT
jgi:hypothetical protein